jgi:hypothetical protein
VLWALPARASPAPTTAIPTSIMVHVTPPWVSVSVSPREPDPIAPLPTTLVHRQIATDGVFVTPPLVCASVRLDLMPCQGAETGYVPMHVSTVRATPQLANVFATRIGLGHHATPPSTPAMTPTVALASATAMSHHMDSVFVNQIIKLF